MWKINRVFLTVGIALFAVSAYSAQTPNDSAKRNEIMTSDSNPAPSVESLLPYQSAIASFKRKVPEDETLAFVITINSPAESYATMIQRELESREEYGITVTVTPLRNTSTLEVENWRILGVSKPLRVGDLSEDEHHAIAGWAYSMAAYFMSSLSNFAYRF